MKQKQTRIADLRDGDLFYLSKKLTTLYSLQKIDGQKAVITAETSGRTYYKPKNTICYPAD